MPVAPGLARLQATAGNRALASRLGVEVQRMDVGYIPNGFPQPYGHLGDPEEGGPREMDHPFTWAQKDGVYTENIDTHLGGGLATVNENGPLSDASNLQLLETEEASDICPEVDHIVPRALGGANDVRNARVLSKTENVGGHGVARPNAGQKVLATYRDVDVTEGFGRWDAEDGDVLTLPQVNQLLRYVHGAGAPVLAGWNAANRGTAADIYDNVASGTQNGITVAIT